MTTNRRILDALKAEALQDSNALSEAEESEKLEDSGDDVWKAFLELDSNEEVSHASDDGYESESDEYLLNARESDEDVVDLRPRVGG